MPPADASAWSEERRALAGDRPTWDSLVARHSRAVELALVARGERLSDAKELTQAAWAHVYECVAQGRFSRLELPGLVIHHASLLAREERRTSGRATPVVSDGGPPTPEEVVGSRRAVARVQAELAYEMGVDRAVASSGKASGFIASRPDSPVEGFGTYMQTADPGELAGKRVRLTASLKTKDVAHAALWFRVDRGEKSVAFDNMGDRPLKGTKDWTQVSIVLDVPADAEALAFGVLLEGNKGMVWFDDFKFEIVEKSVPLTGGGLKTEPTNLGFEEVK